MIMTDKQLQKAALPLLQELIKREMLIVSIDVPAPLDIPVCTLQVQSLTLYPMASRSIYSLRMTPTILLSPQQHSVARTTVNYNR